MFVFLQTSQVSTIMATATKWLYAMALLGAVGAKKEQPHNTMYVWLLKYGGKNAWLPALAYAAGKA